MNPTSQCREVRIECAHHDAGVCGALAMKTDKVAPVEGDDGAVGGGGHCQHVDIWESLTGVTTLEVDDGNFVQREP